MHARSMVRALLTGLVVAAAMLGSVASGPPVAVAETETWTHVGTYGSGGWWENPSGLAFDSQGDLYAAEPGGHRVEVFGPDGGFLRSMDPGAGRVPNHDNLGTLDVAWYHRLVDLGIDDQDRVFILDRHTNAASTLDICDKWGNLLNSVSLSSFTTALDVEPDGSFWILGNLGDLHKFSITGQRLSALQLSGISCAADVEVTADRIFVSTYSGPSLAFDRSGVLVGVGPRSQKVAVGPDGFVYLVDERDGVHRVQADDMGVVNRGLFGAAFAWVENLGAGHLSAITFDHDGNMVLGGYSFHEGIYLLRQPGHIWSFKSSLITIDRTAPSTDCSLDGIAGSAGWFRSAVTVSLVGVDALSGVAYTEYSLDEGATWTRYDTPFVVGDEGVRHLMYRSCDNAGNVEQAATREINIDTLAPVINLRSPSGEYWIGQSVPVDYDVVENGSGIASVETFAQDGSVLTMAAGTYSGRIAAVDVAGNTTAVSTDWWARRSIGVVQDGVRNAGASSSLWMNITDAGGKPVSGATVSVEVSADGGVTFVSAAGQPFDEKSAGRYHGVWRSPTMPGEYVLRLIVDGVVFDSAVVLR